jgi:hypothetical protein
MTISGDSFKYTSSSGLKKDHPCRDVLALLKKLDTVITVDESKVMLMITTTHSICVSPSSTATSWPAVTTRRFMTTLNFSKRQRTTLIPTAPVQNTLVQNTPV